MRFRLAAITLPAEWTDRATCAESRAAFRPAKRARVTRLSFHLGQHFTVEAFAFRCQLGSKGQEPELDSWR
jgi:hypothetical protein